MGCGSSLHPLGVGGLTTASCREKPAQAAAKSSSLTRDSSPTAQACSFLPGWGVVMQELVPTAAPQSAQEQQWMLVTFGHIYWGRTSHHPLAILSYLRTHRLVACRWRQITASLSWGCCFSHDLPPELQSLSCLLSLPWAQGWEQPWFSHCKTELSSFQDAPL